MAQIVLGLGTSHSPQLGVPGAQWDLMRAKDENDKRMDYNALMERVRATRPNFAEEELGAELFQERDDACQTAIRGLGQVLREVNPDVMVVFGDDQHEQFLDDNLPMLSVYHGDTVEVRNRRRGAHPDQSLFGANLPWQSFSDSRDEVGDGSHPGHPALAQHLIRTLCDEGFDIARTNTLKADVGIGHAFGFVYRRIHPEAKIPMVPFMVNTYYPPNQPTPKRCYALGQAVRRSIEAWDQDLRVAIVASGGLSHVIMDEEVDRITLDGLIEKDPERLCSLPVDRLFGGTSEIRNWVIAAGALEPMNMTLVDYVTAYRSPAATGCGMTFAYWTN